MVLYYRCCIFNLLILSCILDTKTFKQKSYSNDSRSEFQTFTFFDIVKKKQWRKKNDCPYINLHLLLFWSPREMIITFKCTGLVWCQSCHLVKVAKIYYFKIKIAFYVIYSFLKGQFPSDSETQYTNYKVCCEKKMHPQIESLNPCNNLELWTRFDPTLNRQLFETI